MKINIRIVLLVIFFLAGCSQDPEQLKMSLFQAVRKNDVLKVEKLIKIGIDLNDPESPGGWSALHFAAQIGSEKMVKMLLEAGSDPDYEGIAKGSGFILKPKVVAQAGRELARNAQHHPFVNFQDPEQEKRMKDPKAFERYEQVCRILEQVTKD